MLITCASGSDLSPIPDTLQSSNKLLDNDLLCHVLGKDFYEPSAERLAFAEGPSRLSILMEKARLLGCDGDAADPDPDGSESGVDLSRRESFAILGHKVGPVGHIHAHVGHEDLVVGQQDQPMGQQEEPMEHADLAVGQQDVPMGQADELVWPEGVPMEGLDGDNALDVDPSEPSDCSFSSVAAYRSEEVRATAVRLYK